MRIFKREFVKDPRVVDIFVAAAVAIPTTMDAWFNVPGTRQADAITYSLVVVSIGALLFRRRWPGAVAIVCGLALTAWYLLGHHGEALNLPTIVALYTIAVQGDRRRSLIVGAIAVTWSAAVALSVEEAANAPVLEMVWPVIALLLGENVRNRRELLKEYARRAELAEIDRERESRRRVEEERLRIAREFHDVVAHTVTAMNVQAGLAIDAFDSRPDVARRALQQVRASGREALQELRATIAVLRGDDTAREPAKPAPHTGQLEELVELSRSAGLEVTLNVSTEGNNLPSVVELAAYRIVQEALTNVIRHAEARNAAVTITREQGSVVVDVVDDGTARNGRLDGELGQAIREGYGLAGMTERAAAIGGRVEHGPKAGGGFRVHAVLPVEGAQS
jgi:signal transduction histidine kinase